MLITSQDRFLVAATISLTAALLIGCSGAGATPPTAELRSRAATNPQQFEELARRFGQALLTEDYSVAYALLSTRLHREISPAQFRQAAEHAEREYGKPLQVSRVGFGSSDELEGERAAVSYGFSQQIPNQDRLAWLHVTLAVEMDGDEVLNCYNCWMLVENDKGQHRIGHFEFRRCE